MRPEASLAAARDLVSEELKAVDRALIERLDTDVPLIAQVSHHILASGGKLVRPLTLLLCSRLCGGGGPKAISLATVVEYLHIASLLHDDVVDDADLRRGRPSANVVFGNKGSVLSGDFLFARSFSLLVGTDSMEALRLVALCTASMARGEALALSRVGQLDLAFEEYLDMIISKTAVLFESTARLGALAAEASEREQAALAEYGLQLGVAFQIVDDLLDWVALSQDTGKPRGHDLAEGKVTLPIIAALPHCTAQERQAFENAIGQDLPPAELDALLNILERRGGIREAREMVDYRVRLAQAALSPFPPSPTRQALEDLAAFIGRRER